QTKIGERLSVLIGGRYDISKTRNFDRLTSQRRRQRDADFTFRVGGVYQVTPGAGFFVSYAEAFNPSFGVSADSEPFEPEQATQYEAGIKTDLAGGRIRTNVSVYRITRDNVLVAFPGVPGLQLQTGQQRSQGFEADAAVRLSDRWNVTAAYTYSDVTVRKDTSPLFVGDRPVSVPSHLVNFWSSYVLPLGPGVLTTGGGGRYVGKREGTLPNSYVIPDYVVADALLDYRLDRWRLRL
ncbi:TonB-dependent siderophore receptor, partial [Polymorphobacter multimanifer]|uniref:TonB-dependent siderophore receptor n=1 Tax=Polymorphobacter multimanifer TaxID=1070431 RepID=UPI00166D5AAD